MAHPISKQMIIVQHNGFDLVCFTETDFRLAVVVAKCHSKYR